MPTPRFIQIHTLQSYTGVLLNRDDSGLAKRLPFGGTMRTSVSSQCLKHHWRHSQSVWSLMDIEGAEESYRSRDIITKLVRGPHEGKFAPEILDKVEAFFQVAIYGKDGVKKNKRQPLLLGRPEVDFLSDKFGEFAERVKIVSEQQSMAEAASASAGGTETAPASGKKTSGKTDTKNDPIDEIFQVNSFKNIIEAMCKTAILSGGLVAALFGRMVTSDPNANIDAPVHVAHAFTVHAEESSSDYFSVIDDLAGAGEAGADHIGESEINSGIFYGYVNIDIPGLVSNLTGEDRKAWLSADRDMAAEVVARLIHLVAETSPGAKKGSTAPYGYAHTVLVEAGDRQPRSLANAFRKSVAPSMEAAEQAMGDYLAAIDENYATGEARRFMSLRNGSAFSGAGRASLAEIGDWIRAAVLAGAA